MTLTHWSWYLFFFFNDTATTEIYTLSLHDALPISRSRDEFSARGRRAARALCDRTDIRRGHALRQCCRVRSEEHTSELQSQSNLVCRLLLEKKKKTTSHREIIEPSEHVPTRCST